MLLGCVSAWRAARHRGHKRLPRLVNNGVSGKPDAGIENVPLRWGRRSSPDQAGSGCPCRRPTFWSLERISPPSQMLHKHARVQENKTHHVTDTSSSVRVLNVFSHVVEFLFMAFTFYVCTSRLLGCLPHTCICVGFSVVISPLLALDVEGGELGEQWYHVAARGSQSRI